MSSIAPTLPRPAVPSTGALGAARGRAPLLVGRDFASARTLARRPPRRLAGVLLLGALLAALPLASLRAQLTSLQYQLGEAVRTQQALDEERRGLRAELQRLRNPKRLAEIAQREGFVAPVQVIALPPVAPPGAARP